MEQTPDFKLLRQEIQQDSIYKDFKTLCIDLENVFLRKVNVFDENELQELAETQDTEYHGYYLLNPDKLDTELSESKQT